MHASTGGSRSADGHHAQDHRPRLAELLPGLPRWRVRLRRRVAHRLTNHQPLSEASAMTVPVTDLFSDRVKAAPPAYFPRPTVPIVYDFNSGNPPPESYPLEEVKAYLAAAVERIGTDL